MPPDRWLALTVPIPPEREDQEAWDEIPGLLLELGGGGVEETGEAFTTYLLPPEDLDGFLDRARRRLAQVAPESARLIWSWQPHEDWEHLWRMGLGHRRVTPRIMVAPSWDIPEVQGEEILIRLDPGMAFGTAEHATTRGCLRLMDGRVGPGQRVADIGTGSGILSIAAVALGAREVLAVELDPVACEAAEENLRANGVMDRVDLRTQELKGDAALDPQPFDGIVSNIQRLVLEPLLPSFRRSLSPGGWMVLSGLLLSERSAFLKSTVAQGFVLEDEDQEDEWWTGAFICPDGNR